MKVLLDRIRGVITIQNLLIIGAVLFVAAFVFQKACARYFVTPRVDAQPDEARQLRPDQVVPPEAVEGKLQESKSRLDERTRSLGN